MRVGVRYEGLVERIGALVNRVPVPVGLAMFGMPAARALQVAERTGLFAALAEGPATAETLAGRLELREQGVKLLCDSLCAAGVLRLARGERYALHRRAAKWLDPGSPDHV